MEDSSSYTEETWQPSVSNDRKGALSLRNSAEPGEPQLAVLQKGFLLAGEIGLNDL